MSRLINTRLLMSGVEWFHDGIVINPFMDTVVAIDRKHAQDLHDAVSMALDGVVSPLLQKPSPNLI